MEPARKFKIIVNSKECGTCSGPTPSAVAKKVVKKLCGTSSKVVKFSLKECKRGCERVCGPYQGRMEKLDRPYKRSGKTITHRVVCGKVRKMRGGALSVHNFRKRDDDGDFKPDTDFFKPVIFFGKIDVTEGENEVTIEYYEFAIFNKKHRGGPVGILQLVKNNDNILEVKIDIEHIFDTPAARNNNATARNNNATARNNNAAARNNNNAAARNNNNAAAQNNNAAARNNNNAAQNKLKEELKKLYEFLKQDKTKYKRIRGFICDILNIDENNNIPEIFKSEIPTDLPEGFDYIPYVAYKQQIDDFDETKFCESLPKTIKYFKPDNPPSNIKEFNIPEIISDSVKREYKLNNLKTRAYAYINIPHKNDKKNFTLHFSITKEDFGVALRYNDIIYIGIVYNNNDKNVVIFYPILIEYNKTPEIDLIYLVYYLFFIIIIPDLLYDQLYKNYKYVLHNFYYNYISENIKCKIYKYLFYDETEIYIHNDNGYSMFRKLQKLKNDYTKNIAHKLRMRLQNINNKRLMKERMDKK